MEPVKYAGNPLVSGTATATSGPSLKLWGNCPWNSIESGRENGYVFFDDFVQYEATNFVVVNADGGATGLLATEVGGVLRQATDTDDNDEAYFGIDTAAGFVKMTKNSGNPFWWEARIRTNAITAASIIVGLANEGEVAANLLADTQTDAAILDTSAPDFVGYIVAGDTDPDGLDAIYMDQATVGAHLVSTNIAQVLVAATWYKVGGYFDGLQTYQYWLDNSALATTLDLDTAEVPDGEELTFACGIKNGGGAIKQLDLDWVRVAQLR
jgi:hypothetical protein